MKRYTDEEIMAAIRAEWLQCGIANALDNYIGDRYQIHPRSEYPKHRYIRVLTWWIEGIPGSVVRRRLRKLEAAGLLVVEQHRPGDAYGIHPLEDEAKRLIEVGRRWWTHLGYSETEMRPKVEGHRYPADESEVPA